jgi:hypothetical protein
MTKEDIENIARIHQIDFLEIEEILPYISSPKVILKAPYMSKDFIKHVENMRPAIVFYDYKYSKGFIHWLAWKLRKV